MADTLPEIRHVVLLMLENRSFDHMLGGLPGVDGASATSTNSDGERSYAQTPIERWEQDDERSVDPDPKHEKDNVLRQLENQNTVADYAKSTRTRRPPSDRRSCPTTRTERWGRCIPWRRRSRSVRLARFRAGPYLDQPSISTFEDRA